MTNPTAPSFIRTYVPIIVGAFIAWLLSLGIQVDATAEPALIAGLTAVASATYYGLIRLLERKWPWIGSLLGVAKTPDSYSKGETVALDPSEYETELPEPITVGGDYTPTDLEPLLELEPVTRGKHSA